MGKEKGDLTFFNVRQNRQLTHLVLSSLGVTLQVQIHFIIEIIVIFVIIVIKVI